MEVQTNQNRMLIAFRSMRTQDMDTSTSRDVLVGRKRFFMNKNLEGVTSL